MACSNGINNGLQKLGLCDLDVNYTSDCTLRIYAVPFPDFVAITVCYHGNNAHVTMSRVQ